MKKSLVGISLTIALATGFLAADGYYHHVEAQSAADTAAQLDAGITDPSMGAETHLDGNGPQVAPPVDAKPAIPDASKDASGAAETIYRWWRNGNIPGAVLLLLYSIVAVLRAKAAWFKVGYRALAIAGAGTFLLAMIEAVASGATPNLGMIIAAATTALALVVKGQGEPKVVQS
jgi:hypothetical protein